MKKLAFNIGERLILIRILNDAGTTGRTLSDIRLIFKTLDRIFLTDDEKKLVGFKDLGTTVNWEKTDYVKEIEFNDDEVKFMRTVFEDRDKNKKFSTNDTPNVITLTDKILS